MQRLSLGRLKWVGVLVPAGFIVAFEYITHFVLHPWILSEREIYLLIVAVGGLGAGLFSHAVFAIIRRMQQEIVRKEQETEALYRVSTEISSLLDVNQVLNSVVEKARELLSSQIAVLCLQDDVTQQLIVRASSGTFERFAIGKPASGTCIGSTASQPGQSAVLSRDDCPLDCAILQEAGFQLHLAVPLHRGEAVIGALCVGGREPHRLAEEHARLLGGLANQAAIAIENAHLYEQTQQLAVLEERDRIAREMHDGLAQILGFVSAKTRAAHAMLAAEQTDQALQAIDQVQQVTQEAYADVRECILGLKTSVSPRRGLLPSLAEYLRKYRLQTNVRAELIVSDGADGVRLSPAAEVQLLRIIQEALTNVRKHAHASQTWVRFETQNGWVRVTVADNGRGFDPQALAARPSLTFGLLNMRERAETVGGTFDIRSDPEGGTQVVVKMPLETAVEGAA